MVNYSEMHNHLLSIHEFIETEYKILPNSRLKIIEEAIDWGSLAKGGLIGGAIALIAWIINFFVKKNKENKEKTKETPQTKEAKEKKINENVETYKKKIEELKKELEDYKKDHPEEGSNAQKVIEYVEGGTTTIEVPKPEDQEKIKNLTQENKELEKKNEEKNKELAENIQQLKALGNKIETLNKRIAELEESLEDAKQKNALAQQNWSDQQAEANDAREESENLKEQLKERENKIQELQSQLSNSTQNQSNIYNLQQQIQQLKDEKEQLNKKLSDKQDTINQLKDQNAEYQKINAQNTNNSNQEEFEKLQKKNESLKEDQKKLKDKNTKLDTELTSYKDQETDRQRTVNTIKERLENLEKTIGNDPRFKPDIEALKQSYQEYYAQNQQLSKALNIKEIPEIITSFLKNIPETFPELILSNTSQYNLDNTDKFYSENKDVAETYKNPDICISGTYMICTFLRLLGSLHLTFKITGNDFQPQNSSDIQNYIKNYFDNKIFIKKDINLKTNIFSFQFVEISEPKIATVIEQFKKLKIFEKIKDLSKLSYETLFQNYNDLRNTASSEELKIIEGILKNEAYNLYINTITKPNEKSNAWNTINSSDKTSYNYEEIANTIKNYSSQFANLCVIEGKWKDYQNKFDSILNKKVEVSSSLIQNVDQAIKELNKKTIIQEPKEENLQKQINSKSNILSSNNTSKFNEEEFKQKALKAIDKNNLEETNKNIQSIFKTHPYYIKKCKLLDKFNMEFFDETNKRLFNNMDFSYLEKIDELNDRMAKSFEKDYDYLFKRLIFDDYDIVSLYDYIINILNKRDDFDNMYQIFLSYKNTYEELVKLYCQVQGYNYKIEIPTEDNWDKCRKHPKSKQLGEVKYCFVPCTIINTGKSKPTIYKALILIN